MDQDQSWRSIRRFFSEIGKGTHTGEFGGDWDEASFDNLNGLERVEEAVASAFFVGMFLAVIAGVIWRYFFTPLLWTLSAALIGFMWSSLVGASLPHSNNDHIQFETWYNNRTPKVQRWCRLVGNALIVITFSMSLPAVIDYLGSQRFPVVGMPITHREAYTALAWFLVATVLDRSRLLVQDVRELGYGAASGSDP